MKITTTCPNCSKDLVITGVKFTFDNPDATTKQPEPLKAKLKGYVGWDGGREIVNEAIRVDNTGDPNEDVGKMVKDIVEKTPQPYVDTSAISNKELLEATRQQDEENRRMMKEIIKLKEEKVVEPKKEEELIPLLKKLISVLDEKMYPELHTFVAGLLGEETKKEESKKRFTAW